MFLVWLLDNFEKKNRRSTKIDLILPLSPSPSMKNRVISAITKSERSARAKESKRKMNDRGMDGRNRKGKREKEREIGQRDRSKEVRRVSRCRSVIANRTGREAGGGRGGCP